MTVNPVPVLLSLSPSSAYGNTKDLMITVSGSSLAPNSVDGLHFSTLWRLVNNYVGPNTVAFPLPLIGPGRYSVSYSNPAPGGGDSNALPFTIMATDPPVTATGEIVECYQGSGCFGHVRFPGASRNLRYLFRDRVGIWEPPIMGDTCNDAPPGCNRSEVGYAVSDTGIQYYVFGPPLVPVLSGDGRYVVFPTASHAEDPNSAIAGNIYERDTCLGARPDARHNPF